MNHLNPTTAEIRTQVYQGVSSQPYEGIYHSRSINLPIEQVFAFCKNEANIKRVLQDLPEKMKNFLELEYFAETSSGVDFYKVEWRNKEGSKIQGSLIFTLSPDAHKGTVVIANAIFSDYTMENEEPSDLINIFLKRMKALAETGQLATTKGQPNGKDEKEINDSIKH